MNSPYTVQYEDGSNDFVNLKRIEIVPTKTETVTEETLPDPSHVPLSNMPMIQRKGMLVYHDADPHAGLIGKVLSSDKITNTTTVLFQGRRGRGSVVSTELLRLVGDEVDDYPKDFDKQQQESSSSSSSVVV